MSDATPRQPNPGRAADMLRVLMQQPRRRFIPSAELAERMQAPVNCIGSNVAALRILGWIIEARRDNERRRGGYRLSYPQGAAQ